MSGNYLFQLLPLFLFFPCSFSADAVLPASAGVDNCSLGVVGAGELDTTGDGEIDAAGEGELDAAGEVGLSAGLRATIKPVAAVRMAAVAVIMPGTV